MRRKIIGIGIISFLVDQIIKFIVDKYLVYINVIPDFFSLVYKKNEGVAFSLLNGERLIIILLSLVLIIFLFNIINNDYLKSHKENKLKNVMYGLLLGGIFGNLFDRIIRGYVIDYISLNIFGYMFPVFNLADVLIIVGVILIIIISFLDEKDKVE